MAADAVSGDALLADAISKMDALNKRMDALETKPGSNNPIKGDDDDDKKPKSDSSSASGKADDDDDDDDKKDDASGGTAPKTKILDDAKGASKADAAKPKGAMKDDSKKSDDGELEIKHKGEKKSDDDDDKKDDAFPPKKKDDSAKKSDDDDDDKKDDSARADAVSDLRRQIGEQQVIIDRLQAMMKPRSDDEHVAFADAQARADTVFSGFGQRAPRPLEGEHILDYRRRLATKLKGYSERWKNTKFSKLDEDTFGQIEAQVYADATAAAANPRDLEAGELRPVTKIDPQTGVRSIVFYGKESFVKAMGRPGRRVAAFRTMAST